jgi:hypothetical protein
MPPIKAYTAPPKKLALFFKNMQLYIVKTEDYYAKIAPP